MSQSVEFLVCVGEREEKKKGVFSLVEKKEEEKEKRREGEREGERLVVFLLERGEEKESFSVVGKERKKEREERKREMKNQKRKNKEKKKIKKRREGIKSLNENCLD